MTKVIYTTDLEMVQAEIEEISNLVQFLAWFFEDAPCNESGADYAQRKDRMALDAKYYATITASIMGRLYELNESIEATLQEEAEKEKMQEGGEKA